MGYYLKIDDDPCLLSEDKSLECRFDFDQQTFLHVGYTVF